MYLCVRPKTLGQPVDLKNDRIWLKFSRGGYSPYEMTGTCRQRSKTLTLSETLKKDKNIPCQRLKFFFLLKNLILYTLSETQFFFLAEKFEFIHPVRDSIFFLAEKFEFIHPVRDVFWNFDPVRDLERLKKGPMPAARPRTRFCLSASPGFASNFML